MVGKKDGMKKFKSLFIDQEVWDQAACKDMDPELFWPNQGDSVREAKLVCKTCPIKQECLELALSREEQGGIWGGTSARERKEMRKERARKKRNNEI